MKTTIYKQAVRIYPDVELKHLDYKPRNGPIRTLTEAHQKCLDDVNKDEGKIVDVSFIGDKDAGVVVVTYEVFVANP